MPRPSKKRLLEMGMETFESHLSFVEDPTTREQLEALMAGFATMLHEATAPKPRSVSKFAQEDKESGQRLYDWLQSKAPLKLSYTPVRPQTVQSLGRTLREMDVTYDQQMKLVTWVAEGGCDWFENSNNSPHPFTLFVKKLEEYIGRAEHSREKHDARIGQAMKDLRKRQGYG